MKNQIQTAEWYTAPFIIAHLKKFFLKKGFRMIKEDQTSDNNIIVFTRLLSKERIEVRGTSAGIDFSETMQADPESINAIIETMHNFLDMTLSPISFFTREDQRSICLPGLMRYEEVLEKLRDYFISNSLELKVYFVYQDGSVKLVHLKQRRIKLDNIEKTLTN